ncbi:hypothetical protein HN358_01200 [Candidatus Uhrbacteria bacterium]|jgi:hypothetical protein|nr:hypothetical protein [Candidatus Uhrbacteria bacterium]MBT7717351.1 hypothetical protein [Candidatus Uhrbacteria bacterium]
MRYLSYLILACLTFAFMGCAHTGMLKTLPVERSEVESAFAQLDRELQSDLNPRYAEAYPDGIVFGKSELTGEVEAVTAHLDADNPSWVDVRRDTITSNGIVVEKSSMAQCTDSTQTTCMTYDSLDAVVLRDEGIESRPNVGQAGIGWGDMEFHLLSITVGAMASVEHEYNKLNLDSNHSVNRDWMQMQICRHLADENGYVRYQDVIEWADALRTYREHQGVDGLYEWEVIAKAEAIFFLLSW